MKSAVVVICLLYSVWSFGQANATWRSWNEPVEPFRIVGNVYYVGAREVSSFLITSPQGHILLDGGFVESAVIIRDNIRKLGFKPEDVKYLVGSHAHFDHAGGLAQLKQWTAARFVASREDGALMERGGHGDFAFGDKFTSRCCSGQNFSRWGHRLCGRSQDDCASHVRTREGVHHMDYRD
jgi:metallo-beta-lactamase class B